MTMVDPDALMAYEARQQDAVEGVIQGLLNVADRLDLESDELYGDASRYLLELLTGKAQDAAQTWRIPYHVHIVARIEEFTKEPEERALLLFRVLERLISGLGCSIYHRYRLTQIVAEGAGIAT